MGHTEAAELLQETLEEEKAADEKLSTIAEGGVNRGAAGDAAPDDEVGQAAATAPIRKASSRAAAPVKTSRR
jgi:hypothetical protein